MLGFLGSSGQKHLWGDDRRRFRHIDNATWN